MEVTQNSESKVHRILALRGFVRLLGFENDRPAEETIKMYQQAMDLSSDAREKRMVLSGLSQVRSLAALEIAASYLQDAALQQEAPRVAELPFDGTRKRMTTVHRDAEGVVAWVKGAPEAVVPLCGDGLDREEVLARAEDLAAQGHRVLAVAERRFDALPEPLERAEQELMLLGLVALIDPPRPEVPDAVAECRSAGITPGRAGALTATFEISSHVT